MPLLVVDNPPDRPAWIAETLRLVISATEAERRSLLSLVGAMTDERLRTGSADDWGPGQIAVHLLLVERGVMLIGLRLARGEAPGPTGQPRPAADAVTREGLAGLAEKAATAAARLRTEFPAAPEVTATAAHPFYGPLNCFGWLLTLPSHYAAHLAALREGGRSAL